MGVSYIIATETNPHSGEYEFLRYIDEEWSSLMWAPSECYWIVPGSFEDHP